MAGLVIWAPRASEDLEEIASYIAQDSEAYSASVIRKILRKTRVLSDFPFTGRIVPEFGNNSIREIFAFSYRIIYRVENDEVEVLAIIHGKRLLEIALKP